jgi:hypothetical protein
MPSRSRALSVSQLIKEVTPGTTPGSPTALSLPNTRIMLAGAGDDSTAHVPSGHLVPRDTTSGLEWGAGSYEMKWSFDELHILFDSLLKKVTATGAGAAKTHLYSPAANALDAFQTYAAEIGQAGAVEKFNYMVFNSMNFEIRKQGGDGLITGDVLAQEALPAAALTASPTVLPSSPISPTAWDLFTADTFAELESDPVQLTTNFRFGFGLGPKYSSAAYINSAEPSWDALGIGEPIANNLSLTLPHDVSGSDYAGLFTLAKKRAGTPIYLRLQTEGDEIETGINELITLDMCVKIRNVPGREDIGPFIGNAFPLNLYIDPTSGKWLEVTIISRTA